MVVEAQNNQETEVKQVTPDIREQKQQELGRKPEETQQVKDTFSQIQKDIKEPIDDYINSIDDFFLDNFLTTPKDQRQEIYKKEIINSFETKGIQLTFNTYNTLLVKEQQTKDQEQQTKEKERNFNHFLKVEESYNNLNEDTKDKINEEITNPENKEKINKTKSKLERSGITDQNLINQYTKFSIAKDVIGDNPDNENSKTFLKDFQDLENSLNIINDIGDVAENKDINQTTQNLISNSPSLRSASEEPNQTIDNINIENKDIFDYMSDGDIEEINKDKESLSKAHPEQDLFEKDSLLLKKDLQVNQDQTDILEYGKNINEKITTTQQKIEQAKTIIKQQLVTTPIIGISRYLDTQVGENKLDNDFAINPTQDITIKDNVLDISGTIDGKKIKIRQNQKDGTLENNQLQANNYLNINNQNKISLGEDYMQNIGVVLPSSEVLNQKSENRIKNNLKKEIKNSENIQEDISNSLGNKLLENYGQEDIVKNRLSTSIQKNITKQETISFLEKNLGKLTENNLSKDSLGGENSNNFKAMKGIIVGIDNLSKDDCVRFSQYLKDFEKIIDKSQTDKVLRKDPILKTFSERNIKNTKKGREKDKSETNSVFNFFDYITKDTGTKQEIQIEDFGKLLEKRQKTEKTTGTEPFLSVNFRDKYDNYQDKDKEANEYLDNNWPTA